MEPSEAPTMASLLAKAKAAKQAHMQRAAQARQFRLQAHKRRAQGLRANEAPESSIEDALQYEPMELAHKKRAQGPRPANEAARPYEPMEALQYEPMELG